jgi:hypothetical protein
MEEMVQALLERTVLARNEAVKLVKPLTEIHVPPQGAGESWPHASIGCRPRKKSCCRPWRCWAESFQRALSSTWREYASRIRALTKKGLSKSEISRRLRISRTSVRRFLGQA